MPQLDFSFYISQITWLVVAFGLFFCISKFFILPKLDIILQTRTNVIETNIEFANKTAEKANKIIEECDKKMSDIKSEINNQIVLFVKEKKDKQEKQVAEMTRKINKDIQNNITKVKNEFGDFEKEINDFVVSSVSEILSKIYSVDVEEDEIKKVYKKIEL